MMIQNAVCAILLIAAYVQAVTYPTTGKSCPAGWTISSNKCYLMTASTQTWLNCRTYCSSLGARMPCVMSSTEKDFIKERYPLQNSVSIGYNRLSGSFAWDAGNVGACTSTYVNWRAGEPSGGAEQCVEEYISDGTWNDIPCGNNDGCACEDNQEITGPSCPIGWTLSSDSSTCYYLNNAVTTWDSCKSFCTAQDPSASMLCIKSLAEHNFVWNLRLRDTWLGLSRVGGVFQWPAGCTSTYTNWNPGEPNGGTAPSYSAYMDDGSNRWDDQPSTNTASCACQMPTAASPTRAPTTQPTFMPTFQPTTNFPGGMLNSPTYKVSNGYAFAALAPDGSVQTWGEAAPGGNSVSVAASLTSGVTAVVSTRYAYSALKTSGTVVPWGVPSHYAHLSPRGPLVSLVASDAAFAGVTTTGAVMAYGAYQNGGDVIDNAKCNGFASQLSSGVQSIVATTASFTALKTDGTVFTWGDTFCGGGVSSQSVTALQQVRQVVASTAAFAARLQSGRVLTWGAGYAGGDSSAVTSKLSTGVVHIVAAKSVFAAFKADTSLVVWGNEYSGGSPSASVIAKLSNGVVFAAHTFSAMAVVHYNGTVTAWGSATSGGDASMVQNRLLSVASITGNGYAFAALTSTGGVITWGKPLCGGEIPYDKAIALSSGVTAIYNTERAFAAVRNGAVIAWGQAGHGGNPGVAVEARLISGVHTICTNDVAFSAIKTDGSVVAWGHTTAVPSPGVQFTSAKYATSAICA